MAKTQEELNQLKLKYETLNDELKELSENEFRQVVGGFENESQQDIQTPKHQQIVVHGLETIGPYVANIPLDSDSKLKS